MWPAETKLNELYRRTRTHKPPPSPTFWQEYVETDDWYKEKMVEDVPKTERKAALIDEDWEKVEEEDPDYQDNEEDEETDDEEEEVDDEEEEEVDDEEEEEVDDEEDEEVETDDEYRGSTKKYNRKKL